MVAVGWSAGLTPLVESRWSSRCEWGSPPALHHRTSCSRRNVSPSPWCPLARWPPTTRCPCCSSGRWWSSRWTGRWEALSDQARARVPTFLSCCSGPGHLLQGGPSRQISFAAHPGFSGLTRTFLTSPLRQDCLSFQSFASVFGLSTWSFSLLFVPLLEEQFSLDTGWVLCAWSNRSCMWTLFRIVNMSTPFLPVNDVWRQIWAACFQLTECFLLCSFSCCLVLHVKVHSGHG